jgi:threonine dehydrogenase-like Zn-dependent dehydrogenase
VAQRSGTTKPLGAERIISLSRNPVRQTLARQFGATDIVTERGDDATKRVMDITRGIGVDAALECVGTGQSMAIAFGIARVGSIVGAVGVPHGFAVPPQDGDLPQRRATRRHCTGPPPPEVLPHIPDGSINPGLDPDYETDLDGINDAYTAMLERRDTKPLVRISA